MHGTMLPSKLLLQDAQKVVGNYPGKGGDDDGPRISNGSHPTCRRKDIRKAEAYENVREDYPNQAAYWAN